MSKFAQFMLAAAIWAGIGFTLAQGI